ncbi:MAG: hypothetical protein H6581_06045 [Bacteroidia bacterium]|nr:hypothetical protein [Bacteroidia bacterium]
MNNAGRWMVVNYWGIILGDVRWGGFIKHREPQSQLEWSGGFSVLGFGFNTKFDKNHKVNEVSRCCVCLTQTHAKGTPQEENILVVRGYLLESLCIGVAS